MIEAQEKKEPMALLRATPEQWGITEDWIDEALDKAKKAVDVAFHAALELPDVSYDQKKVCAMFMRRPRHY